MGLPEKRRAVLAMRDRWLRDEARLRELFGDYGEAHGSEYSDDAEMQRNLGSAIAHANGWLTVFAPQPAAST